jgi:ribosome-associated translation inhibitor RaiA
MVWDAEIAHDVVVQAHGDVSGTDRSYARMKIARIWERAAAPVLFAKVELRRAPNPACAEPAEAKGELDLDGHVVRAEATAPTFFEAIDRLDARLRRQVVRLVDRDEVHHRRRGHGLPQAGTLQIAEPRVAGR